MEYFFDPLNKICKSQTGAIPEASDLTLNLYQYHVNGGEENFSAQSCTLVLNRDGDVPQFLPMETRQNGWTITLRFLKTGLYFYHFLLDDRHFCRGTLFKGKFGDPLSGWQITVYKKDYTTPEWFKGGVMYQIFPDRFYKSGEMLLKAGAIPKNWGECPQFLPNAQGKIVNNDFFGGNLKGISEKLDYLKLLGVTTIYLNPIFESPSNHRYDTSDYTKIDPMLGSDKDFDSLISAAEAHGMKVILDGVFNHTGADSKYFNKYGKYDTVGAYQSRDSKYYDWYSFRNYPDDYECWWGISTLPAVNEHSVSYQNFICGENGVIRFWMHHGIGGWRLDVADELPDFFIKSLRETVKNADPDALLLGEVWEDASNKISYNVRREYFQGAELDSVMNYPLKNAIINFLQTENVEFLRETIAMLRDHYPKCALDCAMNILGTHDTARILTVLGGKSCHTKDEMATIRLSEPERDRAIGLLQMAAVLQFTLPGVPCIYYGDENAMEGYADPFCRATFDWENQNANLISFYARLGDMRKNHCVFRDGEYREIFAYGGFLAYERKNDSESIFVFVNRSDSKYLIKVNGTFSELLSGKKIEHKLSVEAQSCGILIKS